MGNSLGNPSRVRISSRLKYAELTIVSMYEELQVIRATEVTEEELKNLANELCNAVVDIDLQVRLEEGVLNCYLLQSIIE